MKAYGKLHQNGIRHGCLLDIQQQNHRTKHRVKDMNPQSSYLQLNIQPLDHDTKSPTAFDLSYPHRPGLGDDVPILSSHMQSRAFHWSFPRLIGTCSRLSRKQNQIGSLRCPHQILSPSSLLFTDVLLLDSEQERERHDNSPDDAPCLGPVLWGWRKSWHLV